jgi:hypothetical protein
MIEIKFRAWDKIRPHPCMIEIECVMYDEFNKMSISGMPFDRDNGGFTHLEEGDFELMQFIGLQDNNNVDFYVGYIGEFLNGDRFIVAMEDWLDVSIQWIGEPECEDQARDLYRISKASIIGNIHENPELLEQVKCP